MDIFEKASKLKLRFGTAMGLISVEDLWDLPLTSRKANASLDDVAKNLNKEVKDSGEESFVVKKSATNATLNLKFDIVKHIIAIKLAEADAKSKAVVNKAQKDKILKVLAAKEDQSLEGLSVEKLQEMAEAL